jgi:hypothetical protein
MAIIEPVLYKYQVDIVSVVVLGGLLKEPSKPAGILLPVY